MVVTVLNFGTFEVYKAEISLKGLLELAIEFPNEGSNQYGLGCHDLPCQNHLCPYILKYRGIPSCMPGLTHLASFPGPSHIQWLNDDTIGHAH